MPKNMPLKLETVLQELPLNLKDPFMMHAPLFDQIVKLYNDSA
jgi:hypothetical protein